MAVRATADDREIGKRRATTRKKRGTRLTDGDAKNSKPAVPRPVLLVLTATLAVPSRNPLLCLREPDSGFVGLSARKSEVWDADEG